MGGTQGLLGAELSRPRDAVLHPHRAFPQLSGCIRQGCNRHNIAVSIPPWPTVPRCWHHSSRMSTGISECGWADYALYGARVESDPYLEGAWCAVGSRVLGGAPVRRGAAHVVWIGLVSEGALLAVCVISIPFRGQEVRKNSYRFDNVNLS